MSNDERRVIIVGNKRPSGHWGGRIYSTNGLCPTLTSGSLVKNGLMIKVPDKHDKRDHKEKLHKSK